MDYICKSSRKILAGQLRITQEGSSLGRLKLASEKRKTHRLKLNMEAICKAGQKLFRAYVRDISPGGLKIETLTKLEPKESLTFTLEWKNPLKLYGIIKWRKKEGLHYIYGIEFIKLDEKQESSIREITQDIFWKNYGG